MLRQLSKKDLKPWGILFLAGLLSAFLSFAAVIPSIGAILLAYLSSLPLFLIGLSKGARSCLISALIGALCTLAFSGLNSAGGFLVFLGLPVSFLCYKALLSRVDDDDTRHYYPLGFLLSSLTMTTLVLFGLVYLYFFSQNPGGLEAVLYKLVDSVSSPQTSGDLVKEVAKSIITIFPGFVAMSWSIMIVINAALAQGLLIRFTQNLRTTPRLYEKVVLPNWVVRTFLGSLILHFLPNYGFGFLLKNMVLITIIPFIFVGISGIHRFCRKKMDSANKQLAFLVVFYIMVVLFGWPLILVTLYGIADEVVKKYILRYTDKK